MDVPWAAAPQQPAPQQSQQTNQAWFDYYRSQQPQQQAAPQPQQQQQFQQQPSNWYSTNAPATNYQAHPQGQYSDFFVLGQDPQAGAATYQYRNNPQQPAGNPGAHGAQNLYDEAAYNLYQQDLDRMRAQGLQGTWEYGSIEQAQQGKTALSTINKPISWLGYNIGGDNQAMFTKAGLWDMIPRDTQQWFQAHDREAQRVQGGSQIGYPEAGQEDQISSVSIPSVWGQPPDNQGGQVWNAPPSSRQWNAPPAEWYTPEPDTRVKGRILGPGEAQLTPLSPTGGPFGNGTDIADRAPSPWSNEYEQHPDWFPSVNWRYDSATHGYYPVIPGTEQDYREYQR